MSYIVNSNIAKLLAQENIFVHQRVGVKTANFNFVTRVLTLPTWHELDQDIIDMFICHEVGHAIFDAKKQYFDFMRESPENDESGVPVKINELRQHIFNVVDDYRIESKMKRKYPGTRITFLNGYRKLYEKFELRTKYVPDTKTQTIIDVVNIFSKFGVLHKSEFGKEVDDILEDYCARMSNMSSPDDVTTMSYELLELHNKFSPGEVISLKEKNPSSKKNSEDEDEDDYFDFEELEKKEKSEEESLESFYDFIEDFKLQKTKDLNDNDDEKEIVYHVLAEPNLNNIIIPFEKQDLIWSYYWSANRGKGKKLDLNFSFENNNIKITEEEYINHKKRVYSFNKKYRFEIDELVKQFCLKKKAKEHLRTKEHVTGILNCKKLHLHKFTEKIFNSIEIVESGQNHGLIIFIDLSSSIKDVLQSILTQALKLVLFCKKLKIPFEVYGFNNTFHNDVCFNISPLNNEGEPYNNFSLLEIISSRMSQKVFNVAASLMLRNVYKTVLGSTPLNATIICMPDLQRRFFNKYKTEKIHFTFITDGASDNPFYENWKNDYIIQDKKTKKSFKWDSVSQKNTGNLLTLVKDSLLPGTTITNFFVYQNLYYLGFDYEDCREIIMKSNDVNAGVIVKKDFYGYDEMIFVHTRIVNGIQNKLKDSLKSEEGEAKTLSEKFFKHFEHTKQFKIMVTNFIERIA